LYSCEVYYRNINKRKFDKNSESKQIFYREFFKRFSLKGGSEEKKKNCIWEKKGFLLLRFFVPMAHDMSLSWRLLQFRGNFCFIFRLSNAPQSHKNRNYNHQSIEIKAQNEFCVKGKTFLLLLNTLVEMKKKKEKLENKSQNCNS
jgi:hypothetical protein